MTEKMFQRSLFIGSFLAMMVPAATRAEDTVIYRLHGESGQQTIKGIVESEGLAGVKIAGKTIAAGDIVDVQLEVPGGIKLDLPKAVQAESAGKFEEAVREYRALINVPSVANNKLLKRYFDYKIALLTAARADAGPEELRVAVEALSKFITNHPDSWQRVPVARLLTRLHLDANPPNYDAARKVLDDLAQTPGATADLKAECAYSTVDLWWRQKKIEEARKALTAAPANDPRTAIWRTVLDTELANLDTSIKKLEQQRETVNNHLKPAIYNAIGDCYRLDPKRQKDALFAYLWVDVVYNFDPVEAIRAQERLAELFTELKDDERAKVYRNKSRGR